jgi:hypothetical protein
MSVELVRSVLGWCLLINMGILFVWWGALCAFGGMIHRLHGRFFALPREQFDAIHYTLMGVFKLGVMLFNAVPWVVLHIVG